VALSYWLLLKQRHPARILVTSGIFCPSINKGDWRGANIDDKNPENVGKVQILLQIAVLGLISGMAAKSSTGSQDQQFHNPRHPRNPRFKFCACSWSPINGAMNRTLRPKTRFCEYRPRGQTSCPPYSGKSDRVGDTHRAGPHPIGFGIADKLSLAQIELQIPLQSLADVRSQADVHGSVHDIGARHRGPA